jgi:ABC-2 type transport system ATP-binding protein
MEKNDIAIRVNDIHKEFVLPQSKNASFKQSFVNIVKKNNKITQKVLNGVSFEVKKGDFFGIVGRNGSGKSTLLKMLAGVYTPTSGEIQINGNLTPFIELGVGFNPELSGRDNVYLNGALLGFNRRQMDTMYADIVEFAELEPFMDQKLKNYSSGMQVRLAFSIAIKAKNEILIFDDVLAVGDEAFQRKCIDVFERYKAEGQTVILVTHDMETVRQFCSRAILISQGDIILDGEPQKIADEYSRLNQQQIDIETKKNNKRNVSSIQVTAKDSKGLSEQSSFETGEDMILDLSWKKDKLANAVIVDLFKRSGEHVGGFKSIKDGVTGIEDMSGARVRIKATIAPGSYYFNVSLRDANDKELLSEYDASSFTVIKNWDRAGSAWSGITPLDHTWLKD